MAGQNYHITGGSDRVLLDEISLLNSMGHYAIPFAASNPKNLPSEFEAFFPSDVNLKNPSIKDVARYIYNPQARRELSKLLHHFNPDLVHCHIYYGKLSASIISEIKRRQIPLIQTLHEYKSVCPTYTLTKDDIPCERCSGFRFYNATLNRCNKNSLVRSAISTLESYTSLALGSISKFDHFISVSDFLREKVISMGVPEEKVTTIYNFTETENITPNYTQGNYFLYFGRVEKIKGIYTLISAFEMTPNLNLIVAGNGAELSSAMNYCKKKSLNNIKFLGFLPKEKINSLLNNCIATIVPSMWYETFGLTITESFAYGKPVIASKIGGIPEVVSDGEDALLVSPGDVEGLITAIIKLDSDRNSAVEMGRLGRENLERKFNKQAHYQKLIDLYKRLVN
ncbi:glycosyltransferase family 4 protein [Pseudomonas sp. JH-2]|uniref:glycosyltransferase family 4 protein n=1 Tax=Pseudomonas sp. JH-2 TaxID=3114998 RepID=UPI002E266DDA|nr:glycosyltransferase family 4 protein [Pseudomonas sp. JH-2]